MLIRFFSLARLNARFRNLPALSEMKIVDFGCGTARLLNGLALLDRTPKRYGGVDVDKDRIDWCAKALGSRGPFFFQRINARNDLYNPDGSLGQVAEDCLNSDLAVARSVLTHMRPIEAHETLAELRRVLRVGGLAFVTVNVISQGVAWRDASSPKAAAPLIRTEFRKPYFEAIAEQAGFRIVSFFDGLENQGAYLLEAI